ncbi:hypothetical protein DMA11_05405 [Marinilabiliaceae bacterium JC017]|nr:hypothetical protein DMA11_05405 [Marinilabiliaceae bacterium JC017]
MMKFGEVNKAIKTGNSFDPLELPTGRYFLVGAYNYPRLFERICGIPVPHDNTKQIMIDLKRRETHANIINHLAITMKKR